MLDGLALLAGSSAGMARAQKAEVHAEAVSRCGCIFFCVYVYVWMDVGTSMRRPLSVPHSLTKPNEPPTHRPTIVQVKRHVERHWERFKDRPNPRHWLGELHDMADTYVDASLGRLDCLCSFVACSRLSLFVRCLFANIPHT